MATMDDSLENYMYPVYNPYSYSYPYRYLNPKSKGAAWRQRAYLANYGDPSDYFDNYQRAHLKAILSQVNPNLTPRLRKANTKDVGVQVNPRQDASVQCSLGPRTLLRRRGPLRRLRPPEQPIGTPPTLIKTVRFPRTLAVYSPIPARRPTSFLEEEEEEEQQEEQQQQQENLKRDEKPAEPQGGRDERATEPHEAEAEKEGGTEEVATSSEPEESAGKAGQQEGQQEVVKAQAGTAADGKARPKFQFLEQKYGYFHCKDCNIRWESAYVWCVQGTNKVYFKQFCRTCQKTFNPYRVEDIICQSCKQTRCTCPVKLRHVDPKRPHRQDLCGRCKGKRLSCDSTFSFKYII
ncbi:zygote arrest protein 1 [Latimeria chalumnae]|uniref:Zygote arrest 1 n=1 Tax=Latimeria chalumnae TaxID=7897 RepID=H3ASX9_LATCH|nr:PREDICTED: zygote arrest protein 1 [Latimeria chalumnae]|eukprot:XP_005998611.1 PREDICTED: zygote arrest protein 1 [Latimeria chalumnae]